MNCKFCGLPTEDKNPRRRYCSEECKKAQFRQIERLRRARGDYRYSATCVVCGKKNEVQKSKVGKWHICRSCWVECTKPERLQKLLNAEKLLATKQSIIESQQAQIDELLRENKRIRECIQENTIIGMPVHETITSWARSVGAK